jgi:hypothetical protein
MAITEETRHHLYQRLEQVLGPEEATTLMAHLPPVGWADVATSHDLDHLGEVLGLRIGHLELEINHRFTQVDQRFAQVDQRFVQIDQRFDQVDQRFVQIDQRFDQVDQRFDDLERRMNQRFDDRLTAGLATVRADVATDMGRFRDDIRAEQRAFARQMIVVLLVALISMTLASLGLG